VKGGGVTLVQVRAGSSVPRAQPGSLEELAKLDAPTRDVAASPVTWLGLAGARKYRA
jgi:hypothetical protein